MASKRALAQDVWSYHTSTPQFAPPIATPLPVFQADETNTSLAAAVTSDNRVVAYVRSRFGSTQGPCNPPPSPGFGLGVAVHAGARDGATLPRVWESGGITLGIDPFGYLLVAPPHGGYAFVVRRSRLVSFPGELVGVPGGVCYNDEYDSSGLRLDTGEVFPIPYPAEVPAPFLPSPPSLLAAGPGETLHAVVEHLQVNGSSAFFSTFPGGQVRTIPGVGHSLSAPLEASLGVDGAGRLHFAARTSGVSHWSTSSSTADFGAPVSWSPDSPSHALRRVLVATNPSASRVVVARMHQTAGSGNNLLYTIYAHGFEGDSIPPAVPVIIADGVAAGTVGFNAQSFDAVMNGAGDVMFAYMKGGILRSRRLRANGSLDSESSVVHGAYGPFPTWKLGASPNPDHPGFTILWTTLNTANVFLARTGTDPITGKVSLGALPLRNIMVSMHQANGACIPHASRPGITDPCKPVKTGDDGKYTFTPAEALPANPRVRVSFEMAAPDGTFGGQRSVGYKINQLATPLVEKTYTTNPVNFDFADAALATTSTTNFSPASPAGLAKRLRHLAVTYLAVYDAIVVGPQKLSNLVPYVNRLVINVLSSINQGPQGGPAGWYSPNACPFAGPPATQELRLDIGVKFYDEWPAAYLDMTVLHELGHYYLNSLFGCFPYGLDQKLHNGYLDKEGTIDSWTEGFATYFAVLLRTQLLDPRADLGGTLGHYWISATSTLNLFEWPLTGEYQNEIQNPDKQQLWGEEYRVARLLWKLTDQLSPPASGPPRGKNTSLSNDSRANCADAVAMTPDALLGYLRNASSSYNGSRFQTVNHPTDMFALFKKLRTELVDGGSTPVRAFEMLFACHGFYYDANANLFWDPTLMSGESRVEEIGRAGHAPVGAMATFPGYEARRTPPPLLEGWSSLGFECADAGGGPAPVDRFRIEMLYEPPFNDLNHVSEVDRPLDDALSILLPSRHYAARAVITALRDSGSISASVPLVLTTQEYWELVEAAPLDAASFLTHLFVYREPTGTVTAAEIPVMSTVLGSAPGGTLLRFEANFTASPPASLVYSWSSSHGVFADPTAAITTAVFPSGEHQVSVWACNDSGVCATAAATIEVSDADATPPTISCPADVIADGIDATGALVSFADPVTTDDRDPNPTVQCTPPSPSVFSYGATSIVCTASDASGNIASCGFQVTVLDVTPPVVQCPGDVLVDGTGPNGATTAFQIATATDNRDPSPVVLCDRLSGEVFDYGGSIVRCLATDSSGNSSSCSFTVTVVDTPPTLMLQGPNPFVVECATAYQEPGFAAMDAREGDLTSRVEVTGFQGTGAVGTMTLLYRVVDLSGNAAEVSRLVEVRDRTPPAISVSVNPTTLWPPNHKMVVVQVSVTHSDACDAQPGFTLVGATSSEPANGSGDGNTSADIAAAVGTAATQVQLRAERRGGGPGRTYTLTYGASDASGNRSTATAHVFVPQSHGQ